MCGESWGRDSMRSEHRGKSTSDVEVLNVSPHGFWLMVAGSEHFLDFDQFPWFRAATLTELFNVRLFHGSHLHWPDLDVGLDLDRIEHPERYPLVAETAGHLPADRCSGH